MNKNKRLYALSAPKKFTSRKYSGAFGVLLTLVLGTFVPNARAQKIEVANQVIDVTVAKTRQDQMKGLQGVGYLDDRAGMLFVFEPARKVCFWMKNTPIDLDVGFFDDKNQLFQIEAMQANMLDLHCSIKPVRYALEVNHKWFERYNVPLNSSITLPEP